jgi:ribose transport system substrate-binding protein
MRQYCGRSVDRVNEMKQALATLNLCAVSAVIVGLTGCTPLPHDPKETYILITGDTRLPYWQSMLSGLNRAASELKVRAEMDGPENYDPKAEYEAFQRAVRRKPSGILLWAVDPELMTPGINAAVAQGIPVITINADAPNSKRLLFVGTDNYRAGSLAGHLAIDLLKGKGNVVVFETSAPANAKLRLAGLRDALSQYDGVKITQIVDVKGDPAAVFDTSEKLLSGKTSISAFICISATAGPEVGEVVNREHMAGKIAVIAMDADPRTLDLIQKGAVSAAVAQRPFTMAYFGLKYLDELHHHPPNPLSGDWSRDPYSPLPGFVDTGTFVIDRQNAAAVRQKVSSAETAASVY